MAVYYPSLPKRSSKSKRDPNEIAKSIVDQVAESTTEAGKDEETGKRVGEQHSKSETTQPDPGQQK